MTGKSRHHHSHSYDHGGLVMRVWSRIKHVVTPHSHDTGDMIDKNLEASHVGMRALWLSFAGLMLTAVAQTVVVAASGSVALLGDTLHNYADALTAVPVAIAFVLGRRAATRRFTYGLGRSEDLAGLVVLLIMTGSAVLAAWTAIDRLIHPREISNIGWVAAAAVIGFLGNEWAARYRIRIGRRIGSAALVADGLHARTDGFTSLAVLLAAGGAWLNWTWVDPVVGLAITAAILAVLYGASKEVFARILDAIDPTLVDQADQALRDTPGVLKVHTLRLRWVGHQLHAETALVVDRELSVLDAHAIAVEAEHHLLHALPRLAAATVHTDPAVTHPGHDDPHAVLAHHR